MLFVKYDLFYTEGLQTLEPVVDAVTRSHPVQEHDCYTSTIIQHYLPSIQYLLYTHWCRWAARSYIV